MAIHQATQSNPAAVAGAADDDDEDAKSIPT